MTIKLPDQFFMPRYIRASQEADFVILHNGLTGQCFRVKGISSHFLQQLSAPISIEEFIAIIGEDLNAAALEPLFRLLEKLYNNGILVAKDKLFTYGDYEFCVDELYVSRSASDSLFHLPVTSPVTISNGAIAVYGVPFCEGNLNVSGAELFPSKYRNYINRIGIRFTSSIDASCFRFLTSDLLQMENIIQNLNAGNIYDLGDVRLLKGAPKNLCYSKIEAFASLLARRKCKSFVMGGDHSITFSIVKALSEFHPGMQIIHIDAHMDVISDLNGTFLNYRYGVDELPMHASFVNFCSDLEQVDRILMIGIRGCSNFSPRINRKIDIVWADELNSDILLDKVSRMDFEAPTYISFDIDVFDPALAPATSVPVINGVTYPQVEHLLLHVLSRFKNVVGVDIVEIYPNLDEGDKTMQLATHVVPLLLNLL